MKTSRKTLPLFLVWLVMGGLAALCAQDAPDAAKEAEFKNKVHAETLRLMASTLPEDRVLAAGRLGGLYDDMNYALLWKLMNDADPAVRLEAISVLTQFTCTMRYHISFELAQKMAAMLEQEVTPERIAAAQAAVQPEVKIRQIRLVTHSAMALLWLHGEHPLKSKYPPQSFGWYDQMIVSLFNDLAPHLDDVAGRYDALVYELLRQIGEPTALQSALHLTLENLKIADITAERQMTALDAFWSNGLLGENKPMNLLLLKELNPVWEPVKAHLLSHANETSDQQSAVYDVNRIDAAYAEARQQLAPQPTPEGRK
jgi:hypothetical protein